MKLAIWISVIQTIVLIVIAYQWISLKEQKFASTSPVQEQPQTLDSDVPQATQTAALPTESTASITPEEIKIIVRNELNSFFESVELSKKTPVVDQNRQFEGNIEVYEQMNSKLEQFEFDGTMSQGEMESVFASLGSLNKEQRKVIRHRLTKAINSGKVRLLN